MKKTLAFIILAVMLLSVFTVCASAEDEPEIIPVCPDWLITEIGCDNTSKLEEAKQYVINEKYTGGSEPYEFIEITNTSGRQLNIFDYALTNCSAVPTSPSFETLVYKVEPIKPDDGWCEWEWGDPLAYWDAGVPFPQNPSYAGGVVEPGETIVCWMYLEGHTINATVEDFKAYWRVAPETKVFLIDSNSIVETSGRTSKSGAGVEIPFGGGAKNFNMGNKGCNEYGIMLWDEAAQAKFNAMCNDPAGTGVYLAKEGLHYLTCDNMVSWAVVYYDMEITDFVENQCQTFNYVYSQTSMLYVDAGGKRAEYSFTADYLDSTVGKLTDEQKASLPDPNDPIFNPVTPGGDDTTPAPGDDTTPAPGDDTTPAPGDDTTPAPGNDTTPAPGGDTTPAPGGNDTTKPADDKKDDGKKGCKSSFACGIALVAVFGSAVVLGKKH